MKYSIALFASLLLLSCSNPPEAIRTSSHTQGNPKSSNQNSGEGDQDDTNDKDSDTDIGEGTQDPGDDGDSKETDGTTDEPKEEETDPFDGAFPVAASLMSSGWTWESGGLVGWGSTNNFHVLVDYMYVSGSREYLYLIDKVYNANVNKGEKNFINEFYDDTAWWGLAWLKAYDVTKDSKYLNAAKKIADYMTDNGWSDKQCGGGLWWKRQSYKSAISNGLYMKLTAGLHNRISGDTTYLSLAERSWKWFVGSGLIDKDNLVVDGVNEGTCKAGGEHFTYNQGLILGTAAELYTATKDTQYLELAKKLAAASMASVADDKGIITEKARGGCSATSNHGDELYFKGAYVRNLRELNEILKDSKITEFFRKSAMTAWEKSRGDYDAIGYCWQGPFDKLEPGRITAALDLMTAAISKKTSNIALKKTATSESPACKAEESAAAAVDGNTATKWCATGSETSLDIDLGSVQSLHRIRIAHAGSAAILGDKKEMNTKDFEILISSSASGPWTSVAKVSGNTASGTSHVVKGKAQFIRLKITNPGSDGVTRINDILVE